MRRTALFILIFSLLGATGCTGVLSKKQQEVNAMGNEVELTQEKKDFLTAMSMDEERVQREGIIVFPHSGLRLMVEKTAMSFIWMWIMMEITAAKIIIMESC